MKKNAFLILLVAILSSCSQDDNSNSETETVLLGKWKLIEQLADPGDGSGTFQPINSQKIIEFFKDGKISSTNGSLCEPYSEEQIYIGNYSKDKNKIMTNCQNPNIASIGFEIKNDNLILNFASNEGFSQKFEKIK